MTPAWPWALALTIALGALIVSQVQQTAMADWKETTMSECDPTEDEDGVTVCAAHAWLMAGIAPGGLCIEGRLIEAEAAIARVRELHGRHDPNCPYGEDCAGAGLCLACREEYPCATIRALNGDSDE